MADILVGNYHTREYHLNSTNIFPTKFTREHHIMKTQSIRKLSRLELLQEDYRSRLLHEKELKLNALFDQKLRRNTFPKKGSVREFFLNRRMVATSTMPNKARQNGVSLAPIQANSRYEGTRSNNKEIIDGRRIPANDKEVRKFNFEQSKPDNLNKYGDTVVDEPSSELVKLRKKRRRKPREVPECETKYDQADSSSLKPKEKRLSSNVEPKNHRTASRTGENGVLERHSKRTSQEREVYKRGSLKRSSRVEASDDSSVPSQMNQSLNEGSKLSKSLAKIKELSRRKTEEFLFRSLTARTTETNNSQPSPSTEAQHMDEMCKMEMQLRETISRERKKLLLLQRRKQETMQKTMESTPNKNVYPSQNLKKAKSKPTEPKQLMYYNKSTDKRHGHDRLKDGPLPYERQPEQPQPKNTRSTAEPHTGTNVENLNTKSVPTTELSTCANCGRSFMKERIEKHENACKKASARKKKPFDARKKRAEGTEMETYLQHGITKDEPASEKKKNNWREKHENFIQTIRYAKGQDDKPPPPLTNPGYVECQYCRRKFNPSVAERHIPKCKDIKARPRPLKR